MTRVFLLGMMGCGKSTVGRALSRLQHWPYLDNDVLLAEAEGKDLVTLSHEGAEVLHEAEARLVRNLCAMEGPFVAGVPASIADRDDVLRLVHDSGLLVYLRATPYTLARRIAHSAARPWVGERPVDWITPVLAARAPAFEQAADLVIDTDSKPPGALARRIAAALR